MTAFAEALRAELAASGPITVHDYMARSNAHYYAHADPLGADFATAPELTQAFGEVLGLWAADLWDRAGRPGAALVELGPGRGVMLADMLRAATKAGWEPEVRLVETSAQLRAEQAARVPGAVWHDTVDALPQDRPLIVIANEFLDALPVEQFVRTKEGWTERQVAWDEAALVFVGRPADPDGMPADAPPGSVVERRPAAEALVAALSGRIAAQGGAALLIDYGHVGPALGDTLQAMRCGEQVHSLACPGEADLTAHVDFAPLVAAAGRAGCPVYGPVPQGRFLTDLGLHHRTAALARANPAAAARLQAAALRLTAPQHMGALFKVVCVTAPGWPRPAAL